MSETRVTGTRTSDRRTSDVRTGDSVGGVTDARIAAASILSDLRQGDLLDAAFERRSAGLEPRDRRWLHELVWGMLRKRGWLDAVLSPRVTGGLSKLDNDVVDLLRCGLYQLLFMGSVPAYAAIAQTVEITKRRTGIGASKLVNAVLRRADRERDTLQPATPADPIEALAEQYSHPAWLVARWAERWGADETGQLLQANNDTSTITVRPHGLSRDALEAQLAIDGVETSPVPYVADSLRLGAGVAITELAAFKQGLFYVQDPAATLVTQYADIPQGALVYDLCAAPGSKSLELARRAAAVVAVDRSAPRVERMRTGFARLNVQNIHAVVADALHPGCTPQSADVVLVDAPCTGTGTFRRHPDARWRLRVSDFAVLGATQRGILRSAANLVKPGGLLIYSTCSLELDENDDQITTFLAKHPDFTLEPSINTVDASLLEHGYLRVLPHRHGSDGAFAARLRRVA